MRMTRRRLLKLGAGSVAASAIAPPASARVRASVSTRWPTGSLGPRGAVEVDAGQFLSAAQLLEWQRELDALGLRATGSVVQERYVDTLRQRLERAGVRQLHFESLPHRRWLADAWSLHISGGGPGGETTVPTASYIPYSGSTPGDGVTGQLVVIDPSHPPAARSLRGRVALFALPVDALTYGAFAALAYRSYDPAGILTPGGAYARAWLSVPALIAILDALVRAEALGCICVLDLPADAAHGAYYPYDGVIRPVPGVFVDSATGARLRRAAATGARVRLQLRSQTQDVRTRNLLGLIPGATDELMLLHSHTDGPNAIEDNGPNAIVAISQYLARLPRRSLPRTVMVLLTTGHFAGGAGVKAFVARHRDTTLRRTAAALTLEHLGAREWNPQPDGHSRLTGHAEPGTIFTPESSALVEASYAALRRSADDPASVLRPYIPAAGSPDGNGWPAEGTQLWTMGRSRPPTTSPGPHVPAQLGNPDDRQARRAADAPRGDRIHGDAVEPVPAAAGAVAQARPTLRHVTLPTLVRRQQLRVRPPP